MKVFQSVAAILVPGNSRRENIFWVERFLKIAEGLASELHLFVIQEESKPVKEVLAELTQQKRSIDQSTVIIHELGEDFVQEVSGALTKYNPELLICPQRLDDPLALRLLERVSIPALVMREDTEIRLPYDALIVPLSGETRRSSALEFALRLASRIKIPVDLVHVTCGGEGYCSCCDGALMEAISDEFYHEYAHRMDKILAEGCPFSTFEERKWVRELCACSGDVSEQVARIVAKSPKSALVLEWNGALVEGRAQTLREIFERAHCPVLLVRTAAAAGFRLKVAKEFKAA